MLTLTSPEKKQAREASYKATFPDNLELAERAVLALNSVIRVRAHGVRGILAMVLMALMALTMSADAVELVRDGKPIAAVRTADGAPISVMRAASELQKYVKLASGAEIPINPLDFEKWENKVYLGQAALDRDPKLREVESVEDQVNMMATAKELFIFGLDSKDDVPFAVTSHHSDPPKIGTLLSTYAFLRRQLAARWYLPGEMFQEVPKSSTIAVRSGVFTRKPWFVQRCLWGQFTRRNRESDWDWFYRNGTMPFIRGYHAGHAYSGIVPADKYLASEPEVFALTPDGRRVPTQLCTSNPRTVELVARSAKEFFSKNPMAPTYSIGPNDDSGIHEFCHCDKCLAMDKIDGSTVISRRIWDFNNRVASEVAKEFPGGALTCYAYSGYFHAPKNFRLEPNLGVYICIWAGTGGWSNPEMQARDKRVLQDWLDAGANPANMQIYEYYGYNPTKAPRVNAWEIGEELRLMRKKGIRLAMAEVHSLMPQAFDLYAVQQLLWDPDLNVDALLSDFCGGMFGPGKEAMIDYHRTLHKLQLERKDLFKGEGLSELRGCIDRAKKAIGDEGRYAARLDAFEAPLKLVELTVAVSRAHAAWEREKGLNEKATQELKRAGKTFRDYLTAFAATPAGEDTFGDAGDPHRLPPEISFVLDVEGYLARNAASRQMTVRRTSVPPVIDGNSSDPCWRQAVLISEFSEQSGKNESGYKTEGRFLYDDDNLYGLIICQDPAGGYRNDSCRTEDGDVWRENDVEVFVQPTVSKEETDRMPYGTFYQVLTNSLGTKLDVSYRCDKGRPEVNGTPDVTWESGCEIKTSQIEGGWRVELRLPFKSMNTRAPAPGTSWKGNVARNLRSGVAESFLSWFPLLGQPAIRPASLGKMTFEDDPNADSLLKNGGCEEPENGFCGWTLSSGQPDLVAGYSKDRARSGFASLTLQTQAARLDDNVLASPRIPVAGGKRYRIGFCSLIEGDTEIIGGEKGKMSVAVRVLWWDKDGKVGVVKWFHPQYQTQENVWQDWEFDVEAPGEAVSIGLELRSYNIASKRWFDDLRIVPVK